MKAPGKVILFGEHFTVYGLPGIASQLPLFVEVSLQEADTLSFSFLQQNICIQNDPDHLVSKVYAAITQGIQLPPFAFTIRGDLLPQAGLGYSAAFSRSLVAALAPYTQWSVEEQEKRILFGEQVTHGTPSGIDQACARHSGVIWYADPLEQLSLAKKLPLVLVDTGVRHNTQEVVRNVARFKEQHPETFKELYALAEDLLSEARQALEQGSLERVGQLMNKNHELLQQLGVSSPEIEAIRTQVPHALGAKLTGAGRGGCVLILCKDASQQEEIMGLFGKQAFSVVLE